MLFVPRSSATLLCQKIRIRQHDRQRFLRAHFFPFVTPDVPAGGKLHLGSLHRLDRSILRLKLRLDDAAVGGLMNRERLGSTPMAVLEHADGTGLAGLPLVVFLLLFWHASGARQ